MDMARLTEWFQWMTILNIALLLWWTVVMLAMGKFIRRWSARWFGVAEDRAGEAIFLCLGLYKVMVFLLVVFPYVALLIVR